jgi:N-acetyl-gamma-glutamyl-phosphate reductase
MSRIKAGIIGGAGYTGGELLRLLLLHPSAEISFVQSNSNAGKPIHSVHTDLLGETDLLFSPAHNTDVDVLFLCGGHDAAKKFLTENDLPQQLVVIDLSQDFRHHATNHFAGRNFMYGLPELNREQIKTGRSIANPGCFATCIQLALLPLAAAEKLIEDVHINATTGSTGAGQSLSETSHFSWRSNNLSVYKAFEHQHLKEITESLQQVQSDLNSPLNFIPQRGSFARGIFASCYTKCSLLQEELIQLYSDYYATHPFVSISHHPVDVKMVVNTNRCFLHIEKQGEYVFVTSVIDNLLKGASGQAVQNMNLIFGLDEKAGLQLKPSAF